MHVNVLRRRYLTCVSLLCFMTTGGERAISDRIALLVLPQPGDARGVTDDTGQPVDSDLDGYELKRDRITNALRPLTATDTPILMFNAVSDEPAAVARELTQLIERIRLHQIER